MGGPQLVNIYDKLGLKAHALACLVLVSVQQEKDSLVQQVLSDVNKENYQHIVGVKLVVGREQVKEVVLYHIDNQDIHEVLLGSEYFGEVIYFLVFRKNINSLLKKTLLLGRFEEAIKLVEMFNAVQFSLTSATGKEALMEYVIQNYDCFQSILPQLQAANSQM